MQAPNYPEKELERLEALKAYNILDTDPEEGLDKLVELASTLCGAPISLITLIDEYRQWFKAKKGLHAHQTSREISFCGHAILCDELFEVEDARADDRFRDNPLVTGEPGIRFYAGAPLQSPGGYNLGTLCVIDRQPRQLEDWQRQALTMLARQVVSRMELGKQTRQLKLANSQLIASQQEMQGQLEQKDLLLSEVYHRIKNNMAVISSILTLEAHYHQNPEISALLKSTQSRVQAMSLMHQLLYETPKNDHLQMDQYLGQVAESARTLLDGQCQVTLNTDIEPLSLSPEKALPLGLITNEVLTNAYKYAFQGRQQGTIQLQLQCPDQAHCQLQIKDDGIGLPAELQAENRSSSLGFSLLQSLSKQLEGQMKITEENGTSFVLNFTI